jgi:hypothetical protein
MARSGEQEQPPAPARRGWVPALTRHPHQGARPGKQL